MGIGSIKKAIGEVVNAIPGGRQTLPFLSTPLTGPGGFFLRDASNAARREQTNLEAGARALEQNAMIQAKAAQEKAIAAESVRLQEEEARKRTLFGGSAIGQANERKSLLGL